MTSSAVNICVLTLVLLSFQQICHSRPHRSKRGLVKDYFVPDTLVFASDKFEKGQDGKYHLKKSAHKQDSEVNYISADNAERKNSIVPGESAVEADSKTAETAAVETDLSKKELLEKEAELVPSPVVIKDNEDATEKIDIKDKNAPYTPDDAKMAAPQKPDGKDEIVIKGDLPPPDSEEKEIEKISIGQVPDLSSRLVPAPENFRIPIIIPIRHISYRAMRIIPVPPADVSDRLPIPYEDDIVGEGAHESESEEVSQPLAENGSGYHLGNPLTSLLSFHSILKDLKEADKKDVEKESKVVDVLGKKFLMQSNVMKYPSSDNSHTFIRFMSVKPLDEVIPAEPKEVAAEETLKKEREVEERKDIEMKKEKSIEKETEKKEKDVSKSEIKKETEEKLEKESDILKAEETEMKMKFEKNVPKEVILKNIDEKEMADKTENVEKDIESVEEILKEVNMPEISESEIRDAYLIEKAESQLKESKDIEMKDESMMEEKAEKMNDESKNDDETKIKAMKDEKMNTKKMEEVDTSLRKYEEKKTDMDSKKDFFLVEKKKKEKSIEEREDALQKKKIEKKKKKCKCEEKDSDSDGDGDE